MSDLEILLSVNQKISREVLRPRADQVDQSRRFPRENIEALGKAGLLGLLVPTQNGGAGATLAEMSNALDVLAQSCSSIRPLWLYLCTTVLPR